MYLESTLKKGTRTTSKGTKVDVNSSERIKKNSRYIAAHLLEDWNRKTSRRSLSSFCFTQDQIRCQLETNVCLIFTCFDGKRSFQLLSHSFPVISQESCQVLIIFVFRFKLFSHQKDNKTSFFISKENTQILASIQPSLKSYQTLELSPLSISNSCHPFKNKGIKIIEAKKRAKSRT